MRKIVTKPRRRAGVLLEDKSRARTLYQKLRRLYPDARCALEHRNAFELLVATILSAQCTDERVNKVTPGLFRKGGTPQAMARLDPKTLETLIHSTGFFRNKAKSIRGASAAIVDDFGGDVPNTMEALLTLPGVARKTANVMLGNAFNKNVGVVVDTHVGRLARRLGMTTETDPVKVEKDLMALFSPRTWTMLAHLLISHGRKVCNARRPDCEACQLKSLCPKLGVG